VNHEPIEDVYFNWLYSKVASVDIPTPSSTHWKLLKELHSFEFVWLIPGDDNRAEDGLDLRREFITQSRLEEDPYWVNVGCSVLEMLIALARRIEFITDLDAEEWFWIFMTNLGLDELSDASKGIARKVANVLDVFVWRTYQRDGTGGLFPLRNAEHDQRKVELWYEMCAYLVELEEF
jgi:hypothetical protein